MTVWERCWWWVLLFAVQRVGFRSGCVYTNDDDDVLGLLVVYDALAMQDVYDGKLTGREFHRGP